MEAKVNVLELASELADVKLREYAFIEGEGIFPNGVYIETEDEVSYTEEAQDKFNEYYDYYCNMILDCSIKE